MIRNVMVFGEPIWTTTHGGYTLALANNPVYYDDILHGPPGRVWTGHDQWLWWDSVNQATTGMTEPQADRYLKQNGLADSSSSGRMISHVPHWHAWGISGAWLRQLRFTPAAVRWATMAWTLPLWLAVVARAASPRALVLATDRRASLRDRPHAGSQLFLDGPADARTDRARDRAYRRRSGPASTDYPPIPVRRAGSGQALTNRRLLNGLA